MTIEKKCGEVNNVYKVKGDDSFYISYLFFEGNETALVYPKEDNPNENHYAILNGNHVDEYKAVMEEGLDACKKYFIEHINEEGFWSSHNLF